MKLIILTKQGRISRVFELTRPRLGVTLAGVATVAVLGLAVLAGFLGGRVQQASAAAPRPLAAVVEEQRITVEELQGSLRLSLEALYAKLGQLHAHVIRLDALGSRLTRMADLDDGEFNFDAPPAQGGPEGQIVDGAGTALPEFALELEQVEAQLHDREQQLEILESLLLTRHLERQVHPEGMPVSSGWISSFFGQRVDPFSGHQAVHAGVDFASREGAPVTAVAAGMVSFSDRRQGYGNVIEINHGSGFVTRYAHNQANLVALGDKVEKGQTIALMGSTGRATGANLHFEVLHYGKAVNPLKYVARD